MDRTFAAPLVRHARIGRCIGRAGSGPHPTSAATRYHRQMAITRSDVEHVAALARLHLTDDELDRMQTQLSRILEAIETLRDVDTSHVGPTASVIGLENVMRDDGVRPGLTREAALANAPLRDDPFLRVPTVLEEGR
jgi:aspartyl-tRNA(Asn)/glutamyl-tRNA(Gln) amidotransferase subunit C